jgi:hypothetical protein
MEAAALQLGIIAVTIAIGTSRHNVRFGSKADLTSRTSVLAAFASSPSLYVAIAI